MKALVLSITAGGGHNSTAAAIQTCFKQKGVECEVFDTFAYINKGLSKSVADGYLLVIKRARKAFGSFYRLAEKRKANADEISLIREAGNVLSKKIYELITSYDPDVIVYTHIYAGIILDNIRKSHGFRAKTIGIVTDFVFHPYWEEAYHLDYVVTANERLLFQGIKKGFRAEQIKPFGIPIDPKFAKASDKAEARRKLGLDEGLKTLLIMGGSMGYGKIEKTVEQIDSLYLDFQMIVVCGNNKKALAAINKLQTRKKVLAFGFTDKVDELMDAADIIVTKPGGLSTSEALAKRLPMIITSHIPGQEDRNAEFLKNSGVAIEVTKTFPIDEAIWSLLCNEDRLELMGNAVDAIRKPNATEDICDFAISICRDNK